MISSTFAVSRKNFILLPPQYDGCLSQSSYVHDLSKNYFQNLLLLWSRFFLIYLLVYRKFTIIPIP
ncbi:hypothetical protein B4166_0565 [Caldibacillus thermoamylovorans]|nr:hypothetical protein B4166_0565 [Caldibacillus thermoamylovorans]